MSTGNISNPPSSAPAESKSARKKKAKAEAAAAAAAAAAPATPTKDDQTPVEGSVNGAEDTEHPYIKELQKYVKEQTRRLTSPNGSCVLTESP